MQSQIYLSIAVHFVIGIGLRELRSQVSGLSIAVHFVIGIGLREVHFVIGIGLRELRSQVSGVVRPSIMV